MALRAFRQGDVMFYELDEQAVKTLINPREEIRYKADQDIILALGEVTGHKHRVSSNGVREFRHNNRRFLGVHGVQSALVKHEEHNTIPLPQGNWEVVIEREYEDGGKRVRNVAD